MEDLGFRISGLGFGAQGSGFRVQGSGFRIPGSGSRVEGQLSLAGVGGHLDRLFFSLLHRVRPARN